MTVPAYMEFEKKLATLFANYSHVCQSISETNIFKNMYNKARHQKTIPNLNYNTEVKIAQQWYKLICQ